MDLQSQSVPAPSHEGRAPLHVRAKRRYSLLTQRDKMLLGLMVGIPLVLDIVFIWLPAIASIVLGFTDWQGIGPIRFVGLDNYKQLFSTYPFFWPALTHNVLWLLFFVCIATPIGMGLAVLLDRNIRGSWFYQTSLFIPVVISLASVGLIWQLQYSPLDGLINSALVNLNLVKPNATVDWLGDPGINIWSTLIAASWRQVGYVMVLYLAGLKSVDPALREAAAIDGASERQTFIHVVFPVMAPINIIIVVVTVIDSARAFDLPYIINHGKNGLELLSTLITNSSVSEASLIGFGSAIATVLLTISLVPIVIFLIRVMRAGTVE